MDTPVGTFKTQDTERQAAQVSKSDDVKSSRPFQESSYIY